MKRLAATCLMVLLTTTAFAAGKTVPLQEYRVLIHQSQEFLNRREIEPLEAKRLASQFRGIATVSMPDGRTVSVETKPEADALDAITGTTPDRKLTDRFAALDEQLGTRERNGSKQDPHALATSILAGSEFESIHPKSDKGWGVWKWPNWKWLTPIGDWFAKLRTNIGNWLGRTFQNFFRSIGKFFRWLFKSVPQPKFGKMNPFASVANTVLLTLYFLATVAGIVALYFLISRLYNAYELRNGRGKGGAMLGGDLDLSDEGITDPLLTARERAKTGDYRAAIRLTYIASLWKLGDAGLLALEKNRTNWEYQRSLRQRATKVHEDLLPATRLFDRIWYGKQTATQAEFESITAIYDELPGEGTITDATAASTTAPTEAKPA